MTQWGLDTIFNPGKRHMDEEKRRLQSTREEIGDSSGGRRIDLESGKVTIRRAGSGTPPGDEPPPGAVEDDGTEDGTEDGTGAPDAPDIADDTDPNGNDTDPNAD